MTSDTITQYLELVKGLKALGARKITLDGFSVELDPWEDTASFDTGDVEEDEDYESLLFHSASR